MIRIIVTYGQPTDTAAFDRHYAQVHTPLTLAMPGLSGFEVSKGAVASSDGAEPYLIAILTYADRAAMEASFASEAGQAAAADLANFTSGGVTLVTVETAPVQ